MAAKLGNQNEIKPLFKEAMTELCEEQRELFYDVFLEALEDFVLENAIRSEEATSLIERSEVMQILEGDA